MMLRSSSTPLLGSLLPSSTSPSTSCQSPSNHPFRRANSEGNLYSLLSNFTQDPHPFQTPLKSSSSTSLRSKAILETIPSSVHKFNQQQQRKQVEHEAKDPFDIIKRVFGFSSTKEIGGTAMMSPLFLARGLGIDRVGSGLLCIDGDCSGGDGGGNCSVSTSGGGERSDAEMHYRKMVDKYPSNALFLRNYAQFLYEAKGDSKRAEEYYSRAILAEPGDGEILSQYAKLVWELHQDEERASSYFGQAVEAAPNDSHVLATYAEFLWETEDEGGEESDPLQDYTGLTVYHASLASASA